MNTIKTLLKLTAAVAAIAGIAYLVVKHIDKITELLRGLCPKCCDAPVAEETAEETAPAEEAAAEEPAVEEIVAEEPAQEAPAIAEGEPVADESDFEA